MSQILLRIEDELSAETDVVGRARLLSRKAGYLARIGRFDDAKRIVGGLREVFGDGRSGRATCWIMLTEGLIHHFEDLSPVAHDRISRARLLSSAIGDTELVALSSAWKAHVEFERSTFDEMIASLRIAVNTARESDHAAQTRMSMVLCDSFLICGQRELAQRWFLRGRDHALLEGDQASIDALLYNRAAFGLARMRALNCLSPVLPEQLSLMRSEIDSARNLQTLTGVGALKHVVYVCDARLMILEGKFEEAIRQLNELKGTTPFGSYNFGSALINTEIAFCLVNLGRVDEGLAAFSAAKSIGFDGVDVDEQLVVAWMCLDMALRDPRFGAVEEHRASLAQRVQEYGREIDSLLSGIREFQ